MTMRWALYRCSSTDMDEVADESVDLIATDPPYGINFMGRAWDRALPNHEIWRECLRVLKPGAFAFVMCIPRADCLSRMIVGLEDCGFRVDFTPIYWAYASGFPKAQNISKTVDKQLGVNRPETGEHKMMHTPTPGGTFDDDNYDWGSKYRVVTSAGSVEAKALAGSYAGFQPKPAVEVIIVAMKPLSEKTYVDQALANGHGVTWLDAGRIPHSEPIKPMKAQAHNTGNQTFAQGGRYEETTELKAAGRFPANLLCSDDVLNDGRVQKSGIAVGGKGNAASIYGTILNKHKAKDQGYGDSGSFSRYFNLDAWWAERLKRLPESVQRTFPFLEVTKANKRERGEGNDHPTVKPLKLMSYLVELGSRPGELVLDPFFGSGTTGVSAISSWRRFVGYEKDRHSFNIAVQRLNMLDK